MEIANNKHKAQRKQLTETKEVGYLLFFEDLLIYKGE